MSSTPHSPKDDFPPGLAQPALRALAAAGITRLDQLAGFGEARLAGLHGIGPKALASLRAALAARGLDLDRPPRKTSSTENIP